MHEMGSEFSESSGKVGINIYTNLVNAQKRYVLSGRTAIAYIIKDILTYSTFQRVALPDYCCASMIRPFCSNGIEVLFYGVDSRYEEIFDRADVVLIMDYFGMGNVSSVTKAKLCKERGKLLIVDATQTAFSRLKTYDFADYVFVSYRKWTDCLCAAVYSKRGFSIQPPRRNNDRYVTAWRKAANMKKEYLQYNRGNKIEFLQLFKRANELLDLKYDGCAAPYDEIEKCETIDSDFIRMKRRTNAMLLMDNLEKSAYLKHDEIQLMYKELKEEDCPLFMPILVNAKRRDVIRQGLIRRSIYCPVHWPVDERYPYEKTIYHEREISLICDQRYDERDMLREVGEVIDEIMDL
ncbi:MAG: hypothetical protein HFG82_07640 [Dorea sp.]|nr:hypothetical protein [Dorea sp.]